MRRAGETRLVSTCWDSLGTAISGGGAWQHKVRRRAGAAHEGGDMRRAGETKLVAAQQEQGPARRTREVTCAGPAKRSWWQHSRNKGRRGACEGRHAPRRRTVTPSTAHFAASVESP